MINSDKYDLYKWVNFEDWENFISKNCLKKINNPDPHSKKSSYWKKII